MFDGHVAAGRQRRLRAAEREDALSLEEEVALLGEEQAEARQVDLLLVLLHLREVRVYGEVGGQAARQAVLGVEAGVAVRSFRTAGDSRSVVARERVGLQLEVSAAGGASSPPAWRPRQL